MKHLKKFNEGYQDLNQIEKINLIKKLKYQCEKWYNMLNNGDIDLREFGTLILDQFEVAIPDFNWEMAKRDLGDDILYNYKTAPHLCASLINYMQEHPMYFSNTIYNVNKRTGVFENVDPDLARSTFYDLKSFIDFYNEEAEQKPAKFLINPKLSNSPKIGIFSKVKKVD